MTARATWARWFVLAVGLLALGGGCASYRKLDELLLKRKPLPQRVELVSRDYSIHSPDLVEVVVVGKHPWKVRQAVGVDGRIDLPLLGPTDVGSRTAAAVRKEVAEKLSLAIERVTVEVAEHRSQQLFLYGEVAGLQRVVTYRGPETVLEVLERAGGISAGAAPRDVQVVRAHVADGKAPEVFQVNLEAILVDKDEESNIHVLPFDQIYIGETRRWSIRRALPLWMRPLYDDLTGLTRRESNPKSEARFTGNPKSEITNPKQIQNHKSE